MAGKKRGNDPFRSDWSELVALAKKRGQESWKESIVKEGARAHAPTHNTHSLSGQDTHASTEYTHTHTHAHAYFPQTGRFQRFQWPLRFALAPRLDSPGPSCGKRSSPRAGRGAGKGELLRGTCWKLSCAAQLLPGKLSVGSTPLSR